MENIKANLRVHLQANKESQNHVGWKAFLETPNLPAQAESATAGCPALCPLGFLISPEISRAHNITVLYPFVHFLQN